MNAVNPSFPLLFLTSVLLWFFSSTPAWAGVTQDANQCCEMNADSITGRGCWVETGCHANGCDVRFVPLVDPYRIDRYVSYYENSENDKIRENAQAVRFFLSDYVDIYEDIEPWPEDGFQFLSRGFWGGQFGYGIQLACLRAKAEGIQEYVLWCLEHSDGALTQSEVVDTNAPENFAHFFFSMFFPFDLAIGNLRADPVTELLEQLFVPQSGQVGSYLIQYWKFWNWSGFEAYTLPVDPDIYIELNERGIVKDVCTEDAFLCGIMAEDSVAGEVSQLDYEANCLNSAKEPIYPPLVSRTEFSEHRDFDPSTPRCIPEDGYPQGTFTDDGSQFLFNPAFSLDEAYDFAMNFLTPFYATYGDLKESPIDGGYAWVPDWPAAGPPERCAVVIGDPNDCEENPTLCGGTTEVFDEPGIHLMQTCDENGVCTFAQCTHGGNFAQDYFNRLGWSAQKQRRNVNDENSVDGVREVWVFDDAAQEEICSPASVSDINELKDIINQLGTVFADLGLRLETLGQDLANTLANIEEGAGTLLCGIKEFSGSDLDEIIRDQAIGHASDKWSNLTAGEGGCSNTRVMADGVVDFSEATDCTAEIIQVGGETIIVVGGAVIAGVAIEVAQEIIGPCEDFPNKISDIRAALEDSQARINEKWALYDMFMNGDIGCLGSDGSFVTLQTLNVGSVCANDRQCEWVYMDDGFQDVINDEIGPYENCEYKDIVYNVDDGPDQVAENCIFCEPTVECTIINGGNGQNCCLAGECANFAEGTAPINAYDVPDPICDSPRVTNPNSYCQGSPTIQVYVSQQSFTLDGIQDTISGPQYVDSNSTFYDCSSNPRYPCPCPDTTTCYVWPPGGPTINDTLGRIRVPYGVTGPGTERQHVYNYLNRDCLPGDLSLDDFDSIDATGVQMCATLEDGSLPGVYNPFYNPIRAPGFEWNTLPVRGCLAGFSFTVHVTSCLRALTEASSVNLLEKNSEYIAPILTLVLILALVKHGFLTVTQQLQRPMQETGVFVLKFAAVAMFTYNLGGFAAFPYAALDQMLLIVTEVMQGLINTVDDFGGIFSTVCTADQIPPPTGPDQPDLRKYAIWLRLDCMFAHIIGSNLPDVYWNGANFVEYSVRGINPEPVEISDNRTALNLGILGVVGAAVYAAPMFILGIAGFILGGMALNAVSLLTALIGFLIGLLLMFFTTAASGVVFFLGLAGVALIFAMIIGILRAILAYAYVVLAYGLAIVIAPFIIPLVLFRNTSNIFDAWIRLFFEGIIQLTLLYTFLGLFFALASSSLGDLKEQWTEVRNITVMIDGADGDNLDAPRRPTVDATTEEHEQLIREAAETTIAVFILFALMMFGLTLISDLSQRFSSFYDVAFVREAAGQVSKLPVISGAQRFLNEGPGAFRSRRRRGARPADQPDYIDADPFDNSGDGGNN